MSRPGRTSHSHNHECQFQRHNSHSPHSRHSRSCPANPHKKAPYLHHAVHRLPPFGKSCPNEQMGAAWRLGAERSRQAATGTRQSCRLSRSSSRGCQRLPRLLTIGANTPVQRATPQTSARSIALICRSQLRGHQRANYSEGGAEAQHYEAKRLCPVHYIYLPVLLPHATSMPSVSGRTWCL